MDIKEIVTADISFIIWQGCTKISSGCKYCNMFRSKASKNEEIFTNIKSFKYLQLQNYRNISEFIESEPYQVHIFGHSCGLSDRTLLNTIFENENCISIKPYYFENNGTDDYIQNSYSIARHFKSKTKLRIKVVNKTDCEPMVQHLNS